jgi:hypothetical protein
MYFQRGSCLQNNFYLKFSAKVAKNPIVKKLFGFDCRSSFEFDYFCPAKFFPEVKVKQLVPHISKSSLLLLAAVVWAFAGFMLFSKGVSGIPESGRIFWIKIVGGIAGGALFYYFMFIRISAKHIHRIKNLEKKRQPFYSFFNLRSYIMMASMITLGVTLRTTGIVPMVYMSVFYVVMGTPLLLSALRFMLHYFPFRKDQNIH